MNYAGARYFDPFFGMWMSPDPAGQFANPYTYGGDPMNYVDPNGEWVQIAVGAIIGAVVGTVSGAIQCTAPGGGGSCTKSVTTGFVGGAAVGAAAGAGGWAAAQAVGSGLAGAVAGGAVGGAIGGAGNYATQAFVNGSGVSWGDAWDATWKGAAAGAIGGGVGSVAGNYMAQGVARMVGGFAGGVTGSAINGGSSWDVLQGGLMGAGMSFASSVLELTMTDVFLMSVDFTKENSVPGETKIYESKVPETPSDIERKVFDSFAASLRENKPANASEMFELYNDDAEYISNTRSFGTTDNKKVYNSVSKSYESATIHKTELNWWAKFHLFFRSGLYVMHSQPNSKYPSQNYLNKDNNEWTRADAYLAGSNPKSNFYILYGTSVVKYSADAPTLRNRSEWSKPLDIHVTNMNW